MHTIQKARKETIERVFAYAKEKHGMRYTRYTGLTQVTNWVKLIFAAMNLKKFAKWSWKDKHHPLISCMISFFIHNTHQTPALHNAKQGFLDGLKQILLSRICLLFDHASHSAMVTSASASGIRFWDLTLHFICAMFSSRNSTIFFRLKKIPPNLSTGWASLLST